MRSDMRLRIPAGLGARRDSRTGNPRGLKPAALSVKTRLAFSLLTLIIPATASAQALYWSTAATVNQNAGNSIWPRGAIDGNGDFHVVWYDNVTSKNQVYYSTNAGGS